MRRTTSVAGVVIVLAAAGLSPAAAATTGNTTTTFTLTGGALSITVPAAAALGSASTGVGTIAGQLGPVTVTDQRGLLTGSWTATVAATTFTTGGATAPESIPKSDISYWSGPATATTGVPLFTPGQMLPAAAAPLSSSITAFSAATIVGNNSATWDPGLIITVPAGAVAGIYTGTITHSVA